VRDFPFPLEVTSLRKVSMKPNPDCWPSSNENFSPVRWMAEYTVNPHAGVRTSSTVGNARSAQEVAPPG
jgi:hypothetical protein